jgi:cytochrome d ubiquinol oxidase subunit II
MDLPVIWFVLIAILWTGFLVLEGFDFGVGMLLRPFSRSDNDRRVLINSIGPIWDGNEVWLIVAGGAMFAAFPEWYATLFSGFYIPLLLILLALIVRGVAFEWRGKFNDDGWRNRWDWAITFGSWTPAILFGVAFANLVRGVPIDADKQYVGDLGDLLNPFALLGGAVTAVVFLMHGAIFLALKTDGEVRHRAGALAARLAPPAAVVAAVWAVWLQLSYSGKAWTWIPLAVAAVSLLGVIGATRARREGRAFTLSALAIVATLVLIFGAMFPNVMPSSLDPAFSLTISNASSTDYTLGIMTWVALATTPVVIGYQAWTYWVFRKRLKAEAIPPHAGLPLREPRDQDSVH